MTDKDIIKNNFSKYARHYDEYCKIQNICAAELIKNAGNNGFKNILDIGCGTGNYTKILLDKFPKAAIKAVDISAKMTEIAKQKLGDKNINFIVQDAENMLLKERFDLITSNAAFQWFENLNSSILNYKIMLDKNGVILFSIFGPLTFYELNESLKKINKDNSRIPSCNFIKQGELSRILKRFFKKSKIEERIFKEKNRSLKELLKKIKYTGTRGNGLNKRNVWTSGMICKLEEIYKKDFNLTATYQVFFCRGIK